jgi:pre-mRNA-splicing helicase BRR2
LQESHTADEILKIEKMVFNFLGQETISQRDCEKKLFGILTHSKFQLVRMILKNRFTIYFGTLLAQAENITDKEAVFGLMEKSKAGKELLSQFQVEEDSEMTPVNEIKEKPSTS